MKRFNGFSLIELLVVVAIVGILAAIALPAYRDYVTRGKLAEAYSFLGAQRVKMEQYYADMRDYTTGCVAYPPATGKYFTLTCDTLAVNTYRVVATGKASEGTGSFVFTIDQNNNRATTGVPAGWTAQAGCWIRNKTGDC